MSAPPPEERRGAAGRPRTLVLAHRGSPWPWPENSLAAFAWARVLGADGVELDVHATAEGEAVVHHDPEIPGVGPIAEVETAALPVFVPRLETALSALAGLVVNVELKVARTGPGHQAAARRVVAAAVAALRRVPLREAANGEAGDASGWPPAVVSSFSLFALELVREHAADLATAWLLSPWADLRQGLEVASRLGMFGLHPHRSGFSGPLGALVGEAHDRGLRLVVWTVDEPGEAVALARAGVDAIVTNRVQSVHAALRLVRARRRRGQSRA